MVFDATITARFYIFSLTVYMARLPGPYVSRSVSPRDIITSSDTRLCSPWGWSVNEIYTITWSNIWFPCPRKGVSNYRLNTGHHSYAPLYSSHIFSLGWSCYTSVLYWSCHISQYYVSKYDISWGILILRTDFNCWVPSSKWFHSPKWDMRIVSSSTNICLFVSMFPFM